MKAKVTKVRPTESMFTVGEAYVVDFTVDNERYSVVIEPGQNVQLRMRGAIAETKKIKQEQAEGSKEFQRLKKLEGQEIDL